MPIKILAFAAALALTGALAPQAATAAPFPVGVLGGVLGGVPGAAPETNATVELVHGRGYGRYGHRHKGYYGHHRKGGYGHRYRGHRKHYGKHYPRRHRYGKVVVIERPCHTRYIRFTPYGRVVNVVRHCRPGYRRHW